MLSADLSLTRCCHLSCSLSSFNCCMTSCSVSTSRSRDATPSQLVWRPPLNDADCPFRLVAHVSLLSSSSAESGSALSGCRTTTPVASRLTHIRPMCRSIGTLPGEVTFTGGRSSTKCSRTFCSVICVGDEMQQCVSNSAANDYTMWSYVGRQWFSDNFVFDQIEQTDNGAHRQAQLQVIHTNLHVAFEPAANR